MPQASECYHWRVKVGQAMGSSAECADDAHNACDETWCDCGCHHDLIDAHHAGEHATPVERCQACAESLPSLPECVAGVRCTSSPGCTMAAHHIGDCDTTRDRCRCGAQLWELCNHEVALFDVVDGKVGPMAQSLLAALSERGVGDACPRCASTLTLGWHGAECRACERDYQVAKGCRCGGSNLCPDCVAVGATEQTRGEVRCRADCSTMCPVCSEDD